MPTLFGRISWPETRRIGDVLRTETVGGLLLLAAALVALGWANSPWSADYRRLSGVVVGPAALHLDLTLAQWASDGLLAIFFFVAGLELKREFVVGDVRNRLLPVAAAVGGMIAPALVYVAVNVGLSGGDLGGWAVPMATDIAFALAVLGLIGAALPPALRTFLLTLAVVDDLLAILVIALVFTSGLMLGLLALALVPLGLFALLVRRGVRAGWALVPLAVATWALVHASGVHATIAGVLLAFVVPIRSIAPFEHRWRPVSAGVAVPVFAFFAAGVSVAGAGGVADILHDPVTIGIVAGLVVGKTGGIGFTVALLLGELAFGVGTVRDAHAKAGVLMGSLLAALLATVVLRIRNRVYRRDARS